jgi:hypothetical protein
VSAATVELSGRSGAPVAVPAWALADLAGRVEGRLLRAGDPGWDEAVGIWNGLAASAPALVLQPASAADVAAAVDFARDHGLLLGVKGGGHNIAGRPSPRAASPSTCPACARSPSTPRPGWPTSGRAACSATSTGPPRPTGWPPRSGSSARSGWPASPSAAASAT